MTRINRYREHPPADRDAHDLIVRAVDVGVCPVTSLTKVAQEWREPSQEAFRPRTVWSLFNGFAAEDGFVVREMPVLSRRL